jgi:hypothetical protein
MQGKTSWERWRFNSQVNHKSSPAVLRRIVEVLQTSWDSFAEQRADI